MVDPGYTATDFNGHSCNGTNWLNAGAVNSWQTRFPLPESKKHIAIKYPFLTAREVAGDEAATVALFANQNASEEFLKEISP